MCVLLALSCSPQDKHLEAFPSPFEELAADFSAISLGCNRCEGGSPVHTRARAPTPKSLALWLCAGPPKTMEGSLAREGVFMTPGR